MYYNILHVHVHVYINVLQYITCTIISYMYMYATFNVLCSLIFLTYKQYKNSNWTLRKITFEFGMCLYMQLTCSMCMCNYIHVVHVCVHVTQYIYILRLG